MKIIVGLGNPTPKYRNNYHNLGFMTADALAEKLKMKIKTSECKSLTAQKTIDGDDVVIAKPQTFMNLSGEAVKELLRKYGAYSEDLIVIYDDADIPVGKLRLRKEGSAGTHNGMRSIIKEINTEKFGRLRIGFGCAELKDKSVPIIEKVLSDISYADREKINEAIQKAADKLFDYIAGKLTFDALMQEINKG